MFPLEQEVSKPKRQILTSTSQTIQNLNLVSKPKRQILTSRANIFSKSEIQFQSLKGKF